MSRVSSVQATFEGIRTGNCGVCAAEPPRSATANGRPAMQSNHRIRFMNLWRGTAHPLIRRDSSEHVRGHNDEFTFHRIMARATIMMARHAVGAGAGKAQLRMADAPRTGNDFN